MLPPRPLPNWLIYAPLLLSIIKDEFSPPESLIINAPVVDVGAFILMVLFVKEPNIVTSLIKTVDPPIVFVNDR